MRPTLLSLFLALGCYYPTGNLGGDAIVYGEAPPPPAPALRGETQSASPGASYVWAAGHWAWTTSGYVWTEGRWVERPRADAQWIDAHWEVRGRHHIWVSGFWR